jgi:hypothetical protein
MWSKPEVDEVFPRTMLTIANVHGTSDDVGDVIEGPALGVDVQKQHHKRDFWRETIEVNDNGFIVTLTVNPFIVSKVQH